MPVPPKTSLASVLKSEIQRLARREVKDAVTGLSKASSERRQDVAHLKKRLSEVERGVARLEQRLAGDGASPSRKDGDGREKKEGRSAPRFRRDGLISLRKKLGLSADDFGALLGVSGASIYAWEAGDTQPRKAQVAKLVAIRRIGKREARSRLSSARVDGRGDAPVEGQEITL